MHHYAVSPKSNSVQLFDFLWSEGVKPIYFHIFGTSRDKDVQSAVHEWLYSTPKTSSYLLVSTCDLSAGVSSNGRYYVDKLCTTKHYPCNKIAEKINCGFHLILHLCKIISEITWINMKNMEKFTLIRIKQLGIARNCLVWAPISSQ